MSLREPGPAADLALAVLLVGVAGFVDAVGFLELKHLFVSYMSGNTTQFAVAAAQGAGAGAKLAGGVVALFVAGVVAGRLLGRAAGSWRRSAILAVEAILLGLAAASASFPARIALIVLAMGMQNAVLRRAGGVKVSLTYVTGTLVSLGEKIADALIGAERPLAWLSELLLWSGLVLGAAVGAGVFADHGARALFIPAAVAAALALMAGLARQRPPSARSEATARQSRMLE